MADTMINTEKLIVLIREKEPLWNVKHRKHFELYRILWAQVANEMNSTVKIVRFRYRNLKDTFVKERKKELKSCQSKAGTGQTYYSKYKWYKELEFLKGTVFLPKTSSTMAEDSMDAADNVNDDEVNDGQPTPESASSPPSISSESTENIEPPVSKRQKKSNTSPEQTPMDTVESALKIPRDVVSVKPEKDAIDNYGKFVALQIRSLATKQQQNIAMMRINQVLFEWMIQYDQAPQPAPMPPYEHQHQSPMQSLPMDKLASYI